MSLCESMGFDQEETEWPMGRDERCVVLHGFLSAEECDALIEKAEGHGFAGAGTDYPPSYRDNDRLVLDDTRLAAALFERLVRSVKGEAWVEELVTGDGGDAVSVNERIRFCRYRPGTRFRAHQDGVHYKDGRESRLTFMVYLNDAEFTGGDTVFFSSHTDAMSNQRPAARLRPRKGSLILFDHRIWHSGATVDTGVKYVMRSDLMYLTTEPSDFAGPYKHGHRGYVWSLTALGDGRLASTGRDAAIRIWDSEGALQSTLVGHTQSVLGVIAMSPGVLVSYSRDRTVRRWRTDSATSEVLGMSTAAVLSGERLNPDRLVTGDAAGVLTLWNIRSGTTSQCLAHNSWVWGITRFGADAFATVGEDGWVRVWRFGDTYPATAIYLGLPLRSVAAGVDDGGQLAVGDCEGRLHLLRFQHDLTPTARINAHEGAVRKARFVNDRFLLSCGEDGDVCRWDLSTGERVLLATHTNFASDVLPVDPGRWASCGYDGNIKVGLLPPD